MGSAHDIAILFHAATAIRGGANAPLARRRAAAAKIDEPRSQYLQQLPR
jgi:hypothetical protein